MAARRKKSRLHGLGSSPSEHKKDFSKFLKSSMKESGDGYKDLHEARKAKTAYDVNKACALAFHPMIFANAYANMAKTHANSGASLTASEERLLKAAHKQSTDLIEDFHYTCFSGQKTGKGVAKRAAILRRHRNAR